MDNADIIEGYYFIDPEYWKVPPRIIEFSFKFRRYLPEDISNLDRYVGRSVKYYAKPKAGKEILSSGIILKNGVEEYFIRSRIGIVSDLSYELREGITTYGEEISEIVLAIDKDDFLGRKAEEFPERTPMTLEVIEGDRGRPHRKRSRTLLSLIKTQE